MTVGYWGDASPVLIPSASAEERRRAVRRVATEATSATDAAKLLDMLGLAAQEGQRPTESESGPAPREPD